MVSHRCWLSSFGIKIFFVGISLGAFSATSHAATQDEQLKNLYEAGQFESALQVLEAQAPTQAGNAAYHYNLGSIYLRLNRPAQAYLELEQAHHLNPSDSDIKKNRELARKALGKVIGESRVDAASTGLERLDEAAPLLPISAILAFMGGLLLFFRKPLFSLGAVALGLAAVSGGIYFEVSRHPPTWVKAPDIIRSGPGNQFLEITRVDPGMKLRILDTDPRDNPDLKPGEEPWFQVRFSDAKETDGIGWIKASSLLLL